MLVLYGKGNLYDFYGNFNTHEEYFILIMNYMTLLFSKIKNLSLISFLLFLSLSATVFAGNYSEKSPLFTIKIYFEPNERNQKINYLIILPEGEYYSYYLGSDLPEWHVVNDRIVNNNFSSGQLVNIQIHSNQQKNKSMEQRVAQLIIIDPERSRVIWQGELHYKNLNNIKIIPQINNQLEYDTKLKLDKGMQTIYLETASRDKTQ